MDHYIDLDRSVRMADYKLLLETLPKINNVFWSMNHLNYARWLVLYEETLLNVDKTHSGLKEEFLKGSFGVKRTHRNFSRLPVDLTLEQTYNADAGRSQLI